MSKKYNRRNSLMWWSIPTECKCDVCSAKAEYIMIIQKWWSKRIVSFCHGCRVKWIKDEINV